MRKMVMKKLQHRIFSVWCMTYFNHLEPGTDKARHLDTTRLRLNHLAQLAMDRSEKSAKMVFTPPGATLCCSLHECVTIKTHHLGARHFMLNLNFMEKHASSLTLSSDNAHVMSSCQAMMFMLLQCLHFLQCPHSDKCLRVYVFLCTCQVHHAKDGDEKVSAQNLLSVVHDTF